MPFAEVIAVPVPVRSVSVEFAVPLVLPAATRMPVVWMPAAPSTVTEPPAPDHSTSALPPSVTATISPLTGAVPPASVPALTRSVLLAPIRTDTLPLPSKLSCVKPSESVVVARMAASVLPVTVIALLLPVAIATPPTPLPSLMAVMPALSSPVTAIVSAAPVVTDAVSEAEAGAASLRADMPPALSTSLAVMLSLPAVVTLATPPALCANTATVGGSMVAPPESATDTLPAPVVTASTASDPVVPLIVPPSTVTATAPLSPWAKIELKAWVLAILPVVATVTVPAPVVVAVSPFPRFPVTATAHCRRFPRQRSRQTRPAGRCCRSRPRRCCRCRSQWRRDRRSGSRWW